VFTEVFHPSAVIKIRLNAFVSGNGFRAIHEDLVVIYDGAIAVYMEGNDLIDIIQKESARLRLIKWDLNLETLLDICIYGTAFKCDLMIFLISGQKRPIFPIR
jgi:hypothetical protein